jgi:hypothetical protein
MSLFSIFISRTFTFGVCLPLSDPAALLSGKNQNALPKKQAKPGDVLPVNDSDFHYQLPPRLKAGTLVKLLAFERGFWTVEADGRVFEVFLTRVETGWEYEWRGRWLDENDSRVTTEKKITPPLSDSFTLPSKNSGASSL